MNAADLLKYDEEVAITCGVIFWCFKNKIMVQNRLPVWKNTTWSRMTESVGNNENLNDFGITVI
jgi:hypothetical protein